MAPVSMMLRDFGIPILRYLDDWLVLASSRKEALWARNIVLNLYHQLGIVVNYDKSHLTPSRTATYLGMTIKSPSLRALPSPERVLTLLSQIGKFLSYRQQNVVAWRSLLGHLSSLCEASSTRVSPLDEVPSAGTMRSLGLRGRVCRGCLDSLERVRLVMVVRHPTPLSGCLLGRFLTQTCCWSDVSDHGWGMNLLNDFI